MPDRLSGVRTTGSLPVTDQLHSINICGYGYTFFAFNQTKSNIKYFRKRRASILEYYKRKLPHWQISGAEYFVTFRLAGSLPVQVVKDLQQMRKRHHQAISENPDNKKELQKKLESKFFKKYEDLLDNSSTGPRWLQKPEIAEIIKESIHFRDKRKYDLYAYCIMSNHVHIVFRHLQKDHEENIEHTLPPVTRILKNLKSYSALQANKALDRNGAFWHSESYDHLIRNNSELENMIRYTIYNPVKAKLVKRWQDWEHTYCKAEFLGDF
ncbi:MAG: transposase [Balneolaceae bacterium]|nr:transposase [Balneolaceae bacterium]